MRFTTIFDTTSSFGGKVFVGNACLCRTQCVTVMRSVSAFTSEPKSEFRHTKIGALSEQIAKTISDKRSLSLKKLSTSFLTSATLVVAVRG